MLATFESRKEEKPGISGTSSFAWKTASVPVLGLILIGTLPEYLKSLYSEYTDQLVRAYVMTGYAFLAVVIACIAVMLCLDLAGVRFSRTISRIGVFGWRPGESYLSGTKKAGKEPMDKKEDDKDSEES